MSDPIQYKMIQDEIIWNKKLSTLKEWILESKDAVIYVVGGGIVLFFI